MLELTPPFLSFCDFLHLKWKKKCFHCEKVVFPISANLFTYFVTESFSVYSAQNDKYGAINSSEVRGYDEPDVRFEANTTWKQFEIFAFQIFKRGSFYVNFILQLKTGTANQNQPLPCYHYYTLSQKLMSSCRLSVLKFKGKKSLSLAGFFLLVRLRELQIFLGNHFNLF